VESPVGTFARSVGPSGDLNEAVIEREVVSEGVLPPLRISSVVRESLCDEPVDVRQRKHLFRGAPNSHGRKRNVGIGRLLISVGLSAGPGHFNSGTGAWCTQQHGHPSTKQSVGDLRFQLASHWSALELIPVGHRLCLACDCMPICYQLGDETNGKGRVMDNPMFS